MMLRKYMSLLGIGSAKIDLILPKETYRPGEQIQACFLIQGGTVDQQIIRIECDLVLENHAEETSKIIETRTILSTRTIAAEELNKVPFTFRLPEVVPVLERDESYRFKTKLTFDQGTESVDQDWIKIVV
ncbi:sporulation protein [Domibacillus sp. A3M-37]|uniref:sporulation protein n=1 Tax=Domibacillus sp. A3M-37 TaxID=2962037 RepID=UPI0020B682D5|nr:sporulation protein [Domibacillus sp. A3M-37]MCP3763452.1 sporulation protein [Domibacillus sp. A3M-37]